MNKTTGVAQRIESEIGTSRTGLAFNSSNVLYLKPGSDLYTIDAATAAELTYVELDDSPHNLLEFNAANVLYTATRSGGGSTLQTINPVTGEVTDIGSNEVRLSSIAFETGTPVPAACASMTFDKVITGTSGNDTITGTGLRELIFGFGGNDVISGGAGNDCIVGGEGNDILSGGSGNDKLLGEAGNDTLNGDSGTDSAIGGTNTDTCNAESETTCEI